MPCGSTRNNDKEQRQPAPLQESGPPQTDNPRLRCFVEFGNEAECAADPIYCANQSRQESISRFMSLTACSSPTMIARAMMLCPMFSSHICGIAATGFTFR